MHALWWSLLVIDQFEHLFLRKTELTVSLVASSQYFLHQIVSLSLALLEAQGTIALGTIA